MRALSPEEAGLWARVAATIRPLSRERSAPVTLEESLDPQPPPKRTPGTTKPGTTKPGTTKPGTTRPTPVAEKTLDASWDKKLRTGTVAPDRVIDLHGMNLDTAWAAIDRGIEQAIALGDRLVLLVTGHHRAGEPPIERGRIRAAVHDWLAASRHAGEIAAVRGAHRRHGGGGSLYLVLRRKTPRR
ncbi:MAG TPA: Smr/MutS family protein [Sphingomicrobium sp.]